jgi:hypothetical protein
MAQLLRLAEFEHQYLQEGVGRSSVGHSDQIRSDQNDVTSSHVTNQPYAATCKDWWSQIARYWEMPCSNSAPDHKMTLVKRICGLIRGSVVTYIGINSPEYDITIPDNHTARKENGKSLVEWRRQDQMAQPTLFGA